MQILIKTPLYPTESREKVEKCLRNILDNPQIEEDNAFLIVRSSNMKDLLPIRKKLQQERIRDSVRKIMLNNLKGDEVVFFLNKQAAFVGRIHVVINPEQEDYLGPITISIMDNEENIKKIINWLTSVDFITE